MTPLKTLLLCLSLGPALTAFCAEKNMYDMLRLHVRSRMALQYDCSAGAALVMHKGEILFEEYYGTTHHGEEATPITVKSSFPYYSISKEFGIAVLFSLITEGLLELDDPVAKHLPDFKNLGPDGAPWLREKVTLRQLASHTAGVSRRGNMLPPYDDVNLEFAPGQGYRYNELGMYILGHVMHKVTGKPYDQLLKEKILDPLGLKSVRFIYPGDSLDDVVHVFNGPVETMHSYTEQPYPGSLLYGNMRDILTFCQVWLNDGKADGQTIFRKDLIQEAWTDHITKGRPRYDYHYGLMFWLSPEVDAVFMAGAAHTIAAIIPDQDFVVLMGLNQYGDSPGWGAPPDEHMALARIGHSLIDRIQRSQNENSADK